MTKKKMAPRKEEHNHNFEVLQKIYDHWDKLEGFVMFCCLCGEVRKVTIEGENIYIKNTDGYIK